MPLALLLSPDDQAVSAITAVLEEMSVACERPLDGASAAQKLNSNRFDLVLVDCENLSAAKLIFDVCRNRQRGSHPVPVAVVDGRAGLPTAFRLGAELILTKPVSKDQARITIRTAISRVKKEESAHIGDAVMQTAYPMVQESASSRQSLEQPADDAADYVAAEGRSFAAAAAATPAPMPSSETVPAASASTASMTMKGAVVEPEPEVATKPEAAKVVKSTTPETHPASSLFASSPAAAPEAGDKPGDKTSTVKSKPESNGASLKSKAVLSLNLEAEESKLTAKEETSEKKNEGKPGKKSRGGLITLLILLVACGGFYAAWTYEPGFQALVRAQVNQLLVRFGLAPLPQQTVPVPARPASQMPKPSAGVPVQTVTPNALPASDPNAVPGTSSAPATGAASGLPGSTAQSAVTQTAPPTGAQATPSVSPATNPTLASPSTTSTTTAPTATAGTKPGVTRIDLSPADVARAAKRARSSSAPKQPPQQ